MVKRTSILWVLILSIVGMMLFPPYQMHIHETDINMGYAPIFNPPQWENYQATINVPVLMAQWLGVIIIAGILWFFTRAEMSPKSSAANLPIENDDNDLDFALSQPFHFLEIIQSRFTNLYEQCFDDKLPGWLLLLIVQMLIATPLLEAIRIGLESFRLSGLEATTGLQIYKILTFIFFVGTTTLSIYGGMHLLHNRNWISVKQAARILWLTGPVVVFITQLLLPRLLLDDSFESISLGLVLAYLVCSITIASAWSVYLAQSIAIRELYSADDEQEWSVETTIIPELDQDLEPESNLEIQASAAESPAISNKNIPMIIMIIFGLLLFGVIRFGQKSKAPHATNMKTNTISALHRQPVIPIDNTGQTAERANNLESAPLPNFKVGESYILESTNELHPARNHVTKRTITAVFNENFDLSVSNISSVSSKKRLLKFNNAWNLVAIRNADQSGSNFSPPLQYYDFPLMPGKHWQQKSIETDIKTDRTKEHHIIGTVGNWEEITVPAGTFHALKVSLQTSLYDPKTGQKTTGTDISWYAPAVKRSVKAETTLSEANGKIDRSTLLLLEYHANQP